MILLFAHFSSKNQRVVYENSAKEKKKYPIFSSSIGTRRWNYCTTGSSKKIAQHFRRSKKLVRKSNDCSLLFLFHPPSLLNEDARSRRKKSFQYPRIETKKKKITLNWLIRGIDGRISLYSRDGSRTIRTNNISQISREIVRPLWNSFLVESLSLRREREEGGGLARFFPSSLLLSRAPDLVSSSTSSAASLFRRAQCSRLKCSPRGTNARARFERKRTVGIRRLSNFVPKNLPTLHVFFFLPLPAWN